MHDGFLESINVENIVGLGLLAGKNRRKLKGFLGEGFLWLVGGSPGDERLAGSYSVDSADLLDGVECFDGLVGSESNHEVEASGDWSDGFYIADSFELADDVSEFSLGVSEDKAG